MLREEIENYFLKNPISSQEKTATKFLTRYQVADKYHITLPTIKAWTLQGKIKGYRIGRRVLFKETEIDKAVDEIRVTIN